MFTKVTRYILVLSMILTSFCTFSTATAAKYHPESESNITIIHQPDVSQKQQKVTFPGFFEQVSPTIREAIQAQGSRTLRLNQVDGPTLTLLKEFIREEKNKPFEKFAYKVNKRLDQLSDSDVRKLRQAAHYFQLPKLQRVISEHKQPKPDPKEGQQETKQTVMARQVEKKETLSLSAQATFVGGVLLTLYSLQNMFLSLEGNQQCFPEDFQHYSNTLSMMQQNGIAQ